MTTSLLHPLPKDPSEHPGYGPKSVNKSYVLINDAEDIKMMWKPDVFIDQAVKIRSGKLVEIGWSSFWFPGPHSWATAPSQWRCTRTACSGSARGSTLTLAATWTLGATQWINRFAASRLSHTATKLMWDYSQKLTKVTFWSLCSGVALWVGEQVWRQRRDPLVRLPPSHPHGEQISNFIGKRKIWWLRLNLFLGSLKEIVQVPDFEASKYDIKRPNIQFEVHLARRVEATLFSALTPAFLFVAISYLSFFVPQEILVVRTSICMFMLLTMWAEFSILTELYKNLFLHQVSLDGVSQDAPQLPHPPRHQVNTNTNTNINHSFDIRLIIDLGFVASCLLVVIISAVAFPHQKTFSSYCWIRECIFSTWE